MKNILHIVRQTKASHRFYNFVMMILFITTVCVTTQAQCVAPPGTIQGQVYTDLNNNGSKNNDDLGLSGVVVQAYSTSGQIVGNATTIADGSFSIPSLSNGAKIKLVFTYNNKYSPSFMGPNNGSTVQFVQVPTCQVSLGLVSFSDVCNGETMIVTPCFVQGPVTGNVNESSIVGIKYGFQSNSAATKIAKHSETGSVWGITQRQSTGEIFSSAFVKQLVGLKDGHDAIFRTVKTGSTYTTSTFAKLSNLGQTVGNMSVTDVSDCTYGNQVGKLGLGALVISPDEKYLYTINLYNNTLVRISTTAPTAANTQSFNIPDPGCDAGQYRAFALNYHNNKLYVGVTCTAETARDDAKSSANVYEYNPAANTWSLIFNTPYLKGFWYDTPSDSTATMQWLTDIDFTDDGNMILAFADRLGHKYCKTGNNRLDEQKADILMVWNDNGTWKLENNGTAGTITGAGVNNAQGPGGGEFFGNDFFPSSPIYHSEVTLGGIFVMPGTNSVASVVFDPEDDTYSGGLHRYSTRNGDLLGSKELYIRNIDINLGKATGFGDIIATCAAPEIEIGNSVWYDNTEIVESGTRGQNNSNGIQDAGETGISGVKMQLYDSNCNVIGNTTTNSAGNYTFNSTNVSSKILPNTTYFVGIDMSQVDPGTGDFLINNVYYEITQHDNSMDAVNSDATGTVQTCVKGLFVVNVGSTSHNLDLGLKSAGPCSVKITSSITSNTVRVIDPVIFAIKTENIGGTLIKGVTYKNRIPTGMTFTPGENPGWTNTNGELSYIYESNLAPTQSNTLNLTLRFNINALTYNYTNTTEIASLKDASGVWSTNISGCLEDDEFGITSSSPIICDLALVHNVKKDQVIAKNGHVTLITTVCNQGTETASDFSIVNYRNAELDFDPTLNRDWIISQDLTLLTLPVNIDLAPGECRDYELTYTIKESIAVTELVNYAEIASGGCTGMTPNFDFDSSPDTRKTNDKGGQPNTATDNEKDNHGDIDEDDHDPALISLNKIDLALTKTVQKRRVKSLDLVTFTINVINQGDIAVSKIKVTDYIPNYLTLADNTWTKNGPNAEKMLTIPGNLQPGQSYATTIIMRVDANAPIPFVIDNYAEITEVYDPLNRNISNNDIDSTPDNIRDSSNEDDISKASVALLGVESVNSCASCRQGTTPTNGQFEAFIRVASQVGETWTVQASVGLYLSSSALPPAAPTPMPNGYTLVPATHPVSGQSYYDLNAVHLQGQSYSVTLRNNLGELETISSNGPACQFETITIKGQQSTCQATSLVYSATTTSDDVEDFIWMVDGVVISGSGATNTINWGSYPLGAHIIKVSSTDDPCVAPAEYAVSTGVSSTESISCISNVNISMDGDCEVVVTPIMIAASAINPGSPYIVMLTDDKGNAIPNATLTKAHLGKKITAKLIDGCGGNSCWTTLLVEDKLAPQSLCQDIILPCHQLDEYTGPFESDNCGSPIITKLVNETITPLACDDDFVKFIDRSYQATDASGNKSAICNMRISLERPDISLLKFPRSLMMSNDSALICRSFPLDDDGHPSSSFTGVPTLGGEAIYPNSNPICNLYVGYEDEVFDNIGCATKVIRHWVVIEDHCSISNFYRFNQIIEITDTIAPVISPLPNQIVSTNGSDICEGDVILQFPIVTDSCNSPITVTVSYPGGSINNMTSNQTVTLPAGEHVVQYVAYDACGNSSSISIVVEVEDDTAPTMICKGVIAAGLNSNGDAYIYPSHLDDGSFDGCGIDSMRVARVGNSTNLPNSAFKPSVKFSCPDAGHSFMVALRVYDVNGNSNSCMVVVEVQDKTAPKITCPADVVVNCDEVDNTTNLTIYGTATAIDACGAKITESKPDYVLNTCREGYITRYFTAADSQNVARCTQRINVENLNRWDPRTDLDESIDFEVKDMCNVKNLNAENYTDLRGFPTIRQTPCGMVAATYEDDVYNIVQGACLKILRKWTVIDWCEMNRLGDEYVPYTYSQVIKVLNTIAPTIITNIPARDTIETERGNCIDAIFRGTVRANDDCPGNDLVWYVSVDHGNNGSEDESIEGDSTVATIEVELPLGWNKITWSFEDRCGNLVSKSQLVLVRNIDKPTVVPLNSITVSIQPWDTNGDGIADIEKACIYASSLNVSSSSTCCTDPLKYSFSANPLDTVRCFDCFDVNVPQTIQLWAHDCFGNSDFAVVNVVVQDNNNSNICELICENNRPIVTLNTPVTACPGANVVLTATVTNAGIPAGANAQFNWSTGATTASVTVNPLAQTTYTVTATNNTGCTSSASRTLNVLPVPTVSISGNNDICAGVQTTLTASVTPAGTATYVWSNGGLGASINVTPATTTTYTVTATQGGCTNTATRTVTVKPLPVIAVAANPSGQVCPLTPVQLTASLTPVSNTATYIWSTTQTGATITVIPASTMTVTVTATLNGCTNTATRTITVLPLPVPSIAGDSIICIGETTSLTASGGGTYLWNTGATTANISISGITSNTVYRVTVTTNTCSASIQRTVRVNPLPSINTTVVDVSGIAPNDGIICAGTTATITGTGGMSYVWSTGATTTSITTAALSANATFTVTGTDANGCSNTATRIITVNALPTPSITSVAGGTATCLGGQITLTATGGGTYLWSTTSTVNPLVFTPTSSSSISVTVTNANACTASTSIPVTVHPLPIVNAGADATICINTSFTNNATVTGAGPFTYMWTALDGGTFVNPAIEDAVYTSTTGGVKRLVLKVTGAQGCMKSDTVNIMVDPGVLTCVTQSNVVIYLGSGASTPITPMMISAGNTGACTNITATVSPSSALCNDTQTNNGMLTVTLTVTNTTNGQMLSCSTQVLVRDTIRPTITCPANQTITCAVFNPNANFGAPTASDNCGFAVTGPVVISTLNQCNIGTISRTFKATDISNNMRSCTQVITVTNPSPLTLANITFPADITVTNCQGVAPSVTGTTVVNTASSTCTDIAISFTDDAPIATPLCRDTINRTWRVVDSCQLLTGTNNGIFTKVQKIIVIVPAPVINGPLVINLTVNPNTCLATLNANPLLHSAVGCNLVLSNTRNANPNFNINGNYPVGTTNVTLTARETCLNQTVTLQVQIIVTDNTTPSFHCIKTFPAMMDTNPPTARDTANNHAVITVSCSNPQTIRVSFSRTNVADSITIYDCADLLIDHTFKVYLWVDGVVTDSCITIATPVDPLFFCTSTGGRIAGNIKTENLQSVPNVQLNLEGANMTSPITGMDGKYSFSPMNTGGEYTLVPQRNDHALEGVSTLDLVMIQRHILKLKELESPYKLIAADINKDNKVTATDIVELRKLILGIYSQFPTNSSWRMIDSKYSFQDPKNPFAAPFAEKYYIPELQGSMLLNWVGVKIGDVNDSYVTNIHDGLLVSRSANLGLSITDAKTKIGANVVAVKASRNEVIAGFQTAIKIKDAQNISVSNGTLTLDPSQYRITDEGTLVISWFEKQAHTAQVNEEMFYVHFDATSSSYLSEIFTQTNTLSNEYYDASLNTRSMNILFDSEKSLPFELIGNSPNPWTQSTDIKFFLPADGDVTIKVSDITGRSLYVNTSSFAKGQNTIILDADKINNAGVLIYELMYNNQVKTMKMLNIR